MSIILYISSKDCQNVAIDKIVNEINVVCQVHRTFNSVEENGKLVRDYLYVDDVSNAYIKLMAEMFKNKKNLYIYNVGSKENLSVSKLVNLIIKKIRKKKVSPVILNNSKIEIKKQKLNYKKINRELGWKPQWNIHNAMNITIDWYKKNLRLFK